METRRSMRLRSRDNAASDANAPAAGNSRSVFGDASNRHGKKSKSEQTKRAKAKETRSTTEADPAENEAAEDPAEKPAARPKRGRAASAKSATTAEAAADRPSGSKSRTSSAADENANNDKPAAEKEGAKKRVSEDSAKDTARSTKRFKHQIAGENEIIIPRRSTRTRTSRDAAKAAANNRKAAKKSQKFVVQETPIISDPNFIVPPDFRMQRDTFDGLNFTHGIAHYDAPDRDDPLLCKDYVTDMFQHMYVAETNTRPETYMHNQEDINSKMRAILVDWLVEVHMKFRLNPNTLYLCINIIDRYCARVEVRRSKLQLVGVTALLVACKHEEIYPPEVRDCVYITDRAYNRQEVLDMEQSILKELDWKISVPTAYPFLHRFLGLVNGSKLAGHAAHYYLERSLQEHDMLDYRPSEVSAAAVLLAINNPDILLHEEEYDKVLPGVPKILLEYTGFDKDTLIDIAKELAAKVANEPITASKRRLVAVKKKFESVKYMRVSTEVELPSARHISRLTTL